jgi:hypothetical protein
LSERGHSYGGTGIRNNLKTEEKNAFTWGIAGYLLTSGELFFQSILKLEHQRGAVRREFCRDLFSIAAAITAEGRSQYGSKKVHHHRISRQTEVLILALYPVG